MFKDAIVGDKVWSFEYGWGVVEDTQQAGSNVLNMFVKFLRPLRVICYNFSGSVWNSAANPTLFWDEFKFDVPPKPKKKVKKYHLLIESTTKPGTYWLSRKRYKYLAEYNNDSSWQNSRAVNVLLQTEEEYYE